MKVSVLTPTRDRERFMPALYRTFAAQTEPDRELLVYDDSDEPSPFFSALSDPRVRYHHSREKVANGEALNRLVGLARAEVVAVFDDDDYYAPGYLAWMLQRLGDADLVKLSGWFAYSTPDRALFYWDTTECHPVHHRVGAGPLALVQGNMGPDFVEKNLAGYGFSFVFRRRVVERVQFDFEKGNDCRFLLELRRRGGRINTVADAQGVAVHVLHGGNSSWVFPQYRLPLVLAATLLPGFEAYLAGVQGTPTPGSERAEGRT